MVDLTRKSYPTARLLDLVPGRSGTVYKDWLTARGPVFRDGIQVATLDPFQGYKNAIDDQLEDATCVLDAFHIVKLATSAVDEVRRRIQQQTLGHRGRRGDPLYGIRNLLRAGRERLTDRQRARLQAAFAAHEDHISVEGPKASGTCSIRRPCLRASGLSAVSGTEAVNGLIELGRRIARGFHRFAHYRLRMLLIAGGLDASPHTQL